MKLEWPSLRDRPVGTTSDFVWVVDDKVVGFTGLYQWRPIELEVCGMVHPAWRGQGIGSALYDAAAAEISRRAPMRALLICDRRLAGAARFALARGGELNHSEHRMQQRRDPDPRSSSAAEVTTRPARSDDASFVASCLAAAFDEELAEVDPGDEGAVARQIRGTTVIEADGRSVGVMRVEREGSVASIYGFAVLPECQGRGFGRAALAEVTEALRGSGAGTISLEVLSTNDSALHLYTTCGFDAIGTEDYYSMPIEPAEAPA